VNIYQAIALVSAGLAVLAGSWDAYRLRHEQRYSAPVMAITAGGPVLSLWLYLTVTNLSLKQMVSIGLLAAGAAVGVYFARRVSLTEVGEGGQIRLVGASWLPLPAALSVAAIQISGAAGSFTAQVLSLAALEVTVGFGVGAAVTLFYLRSTFGQTAQPGAPTQPTTPAQPTAG
jgi:hypothetical protein